MEEGDTLIKKYDPDLLERQEKTKKINQDDN